MCTKMTLPKTEAAFKGKKVSFSNTSFLNDARIKKIQICFDRSEKGFSFPHLIGSPFIASHISSLSIQ